MSPVGTQAQGGAQPAPAPSAAANDPTFMMVTFMKVSEGKEGDWEKLERESWKPMHNIRVKDGSIKSWAAIAQWVPGDESNGPIYGTVTTHRGWPNPMTTDWPQLFTKAQGKGDFGSLVQQTENVRKMVRTEIWQVLDQTEPPAMQTK
jgi:hypothetical protein